MSKKKLDIKQVLGNIDKNNKDWFSNLSEEDQEGFEPFIVMQFLSSNNNDARHIDALELTNEVLNKDFTSIYANKDLFYRLCCVCRSDQKSFRPFIKPPKSKRSMSLLQKLVLEYSDEKMSEQECKMLIKKNKVYGREFWIDLAESHDWSDDDIKKLDKEIKQVI